MFKSPVEFVRNKEQLMTPHETVRELVELGKKLSNTEEKYRVAKEAKATVVMSDITFRDVLDARANYYHAAANARPAIAELLAENERFREERTALIAMTEEQAARIAELEEALAAMIKYNVWQVQCGNEHHPTLPSGIASAKQALAGKEVK